MVIDVVTFNGEKDIWDIRYNVLKDYVDEFVVIEFDRTFSGKEKPFYGEDFIMNYATGTPFVRYIKVKDGIWKKYEELARSSKNTEYGKGAQHWVEEFCQKEYIKDCLSDLKDDDIVFIGDVDEIWQPVNLQGMKLKRRGKIELRVYSYFLNNRSTERFWGTLVANYKDIKSRTLNHLRSQAAYHDLLPLGGWHFTSMGGSEEVRRKLLDSYTKESYANEYVMNNLDQNIKENKDFLGRDFTYNIDESEWPQYLKDNRDKYKHLLR